MPFTLPPRPSVIQKLADIFILTLSIVLIGSDMHANSDYDSTEIEFVQFRNQIIEEINKQRTSYSEDLRILKQQGTTYASEIQILYEVIQDLSSQVSQLKGKIAHLEQKNAELNHHVDSRTNKLNKLIDDERNSRKKADDELIKDISVELSTLYKPRKITGSSGADSSGTQPYLLYEVVKGDTLGAIAKAFNISLKRLKTFNDLDTDIIIVGKKIKIPEN